MKAKEYASRIIESNYSMDAIVQLSKDLLDEVVTICNARNCQRASAINSVFKEIDQKYRAICRIVNEKENIMIDSGFKILMQDVYKDSRLVHELDYLKESEVAK